MSGGDIRGSRKLMEKIINGRHVQYWHQLFEFREEDHNQSGEGRFQLGTLTDFIGAVTG